MRAANRCIEAASRRGARTVGIHTAAFMKVACHLYEKRLCPLPQIRPACIFTFDRASVTSSLSPVGWTQPRPRSATSEGL